MTKSLEEIMSFPLSEWTPQDIDVIIAYQRKAQADYVAGAKPKKDIGPKLKLQELMNKAGFKKPEPPKPASGGGVRRI